jgi:hypothetical protein
MGRQLLSERLSSLVGHKHVPGSITSKGASRAGTSDALAPGPRQNVSVCVRVRPLNAQELDRGDTSVWTVDDENYVCLAGQASAPKYSFDSVHREGSTNQNIYKSVGAPVVANAVDGFNGTIFAYGVTSSGKTHTMMGHPGEPGLVPLALQHLFRLIEETRERFFLVKFSMLEIYNETINDLLDPTSINLRLREDSRRDLVFVEGVKNVEVRPRGALVAVRLNWTL